MTTPYGTDCNTWPDNSGIPDLDPAFRLLSGGQSVVQGLARRLTTQRGSFVEALEEGLDLRMWLNLKWGPQRHVEAKFAIEREPERDDRVRQVVANVSLNKSTRTLTVKIDAVLADSGKEFGFIAVVTEASTQIFGLR